MLLAGIVPVVERRICNYAIMLVEQIKENESYGKSQHFTKIKIKEPIKEGEIVECIITGIHQDILQANIL